MPRPPRATCPSARASAPRRTRRSWTCRRACSRCPASSCTIRAPSPSTASSGTSAASSSNYGFFSTYIIRGLASQFYRDGVLDASQVNGYLRTLTDVERVDILKGPGSALYGSGAPGGTISIVSKLPTSTPLYSGYAVGGSFGTYQFGTDMGGPLGE